MKKKQRQSKKKVERRTSFNSFHAAVLATKARRTLLLVERKNGVMMTVIVMQSIYAWMILVSCSALCIFLCSTAFGICGIILVFSRKKRKREQNGIWSMKGIEKESKDFFGSFKHRRKHNDVDGNNTFWCGWHWQLVVLYECFDVLSTSFESAE